MQAQIEIDQNMKALMSHFFTRGKINPDVLLTAFNSISSIVGPNHEKITFTSIAALKAALEAINLRQEERYKINSEEALDRRLSKYGLAEKDLLNSEKLIYEALTFHFLSEHEKSMSRKVEYMGTLTSKTRAGTAKIAKKQEEDRIQTIKKIQAELQQESAEAIRIFVNTLSETGLNVDYTVKARFQWLSDFFNKPSLGRDLLYGAVIGLLVVGFIALVVGLGVATSGIAPAMLGAAVAVLSPGEITGIGLAIVAFYAAIAGIIGKLIRAESDSQIETSPEASLSSTASIMEAGIKPSGNLTRVLTPELQRPKAKPLAEESLQSRSEAVLMSLGLVINDVHNIPLACACIEEIIQIDKSQNENTRQDLVRKIAEIELIIKDIPDTLTAKGVLQEYVNYVVNQVDSIPDSIPCFSA